MNLAFQHLTYGLRLLMREWRAGELHVLVAALVVAVAAVTAVGFFTDRVERAMTLQASELLAADTWDRRRNGREPVHTDKPWNAIQARRHPIVLDRNHRT